MKRNTSKIKDLNNYRLSLKVFSWDELADDLMKLEVEFAALKKHLKPKEIKVFKGLIRLYEEEKKSRFPKESSYFSRMYDQRDLIGITDEEVDFS